jgi:hypothetical protein
MFKGALGFVSIFCVDGCDPGAEIHGEALVTPSVQMMFTTEELGLLVTQTDCPNPATQTQSVYLLCEPSQAPFKVKFDFSNMPCFEEPKVRAWIEPGRAGPCGKSSANGTNLRQQTSWLATAEAPAFKG